MSDDFYYNTHHDETMGMEKMAYTRFYTANVVRRATQAPTKLDVFDKLQLPNGSVLHTLNGFDTLVSNNGGLPDTTNPLLTNEKFPIWLKLQRDLPSGSGYPFGVDENYIYRPNTLSPQISHFYQSHRQFHRIISDRTLGSLAGVLTWVDYSPLNEVKVNGTLHQYRKFDILFRTILNTVTAIGSGRHHYILIPQSGEVHARALLQRTFRELSTGTLNALLGDPSIFPVLHLLGFVYGKTRSLNVTPYKEDIRLLGKNNPVFESMKSTSLLERLPKNLLESINFVFQYKNGAVIYNLADVERFADDNTFYNKLYRHLMNLRLEGAALPDNLDNDADDGTVVPDKGTVSSPVVNKSTEGDAPPVSKDNPKAEDPVKDTKPTPVPSTRPVVEIDLQTEPTKVNFEDRVRAAAIAHTEKDIAVEPKKENRRNTLLDNHLKASLAGKSIGELSQPPSTQSVTPKIMGYVTSTPEKSYQKSSLVAIDQAYQKHGYHHELAKVVGSLAKHGLFITKTQEEKIHTEMDRTITYKLDLVDIGGKSHHVKFTLPHVDEDGLMKLSGIEYRLTRQIANIPICKISPTRVNLASYYNKVIIERIQSKRYSYEQDVVKLITALRTQGLVAATVGTAPLPTKSVAYDYTAVGRGFTEIAFSGYTLRFGGDHASYPDDYHPRVISLIKDLEGRFGVYAGEGPERNQLLFWSHNNSIHLVGEKGILKSWSSFHHMLVDNLGDVAKPERTPMEWTQANIIDRTIPLVYILAYRLGLKKLLSMINLDYRFYTKRSDVQLDIDDIAVPMADGILVFNRYPLSRSLIACGLLWADLREFTFDHLSVPDVYGRILQQKKLSAGVLKGLDGFFDFFVDPITETVLEKMHEPVTFHELLLRANVMLTDYHALESSSVSLHRTRLYERHIGAVYNEIYRALANYRNNPSTKKSFSINPEAVFLKLVQDATSSPNEVINPVHEVKQRSNITFTGAGGRTANSFILKDRIYPKDGLGVISDAVPDSGKVGITAYLSASPNIDDIHGIPKPYKPGDVLEPPQILSIGSMVMPGGTTDDGKRNSYLSIQISHYVPNHNDGETLAVRTGYDEVLPHLSSQVFSIPAEQDGTVESIDDKQKVLKVRYADKTAESLRALRLPYLDAVLDTYRQTQTSFGYLVPESEISQYPIGGVFALTKNTYGKVVDRLRCESVDTIPDKDVIRKQGTLVSDLSSGRIKALYYIRFSPMGTKTPGEVKAYSFASIYAQNSGSYLLQTRVPNVSVGDKFKTGDILIYNPGFFVPNPMNNQVTFKHGVIANVALIEKSSNHEDACEISQSLSDRLKMTPCHQKEVVTRCNAAVLNIVKLGDHVETSDSLCVISDEYLVGTSLTLDVENLDIIEKLNRQTPTAGYAGTIRKIRILYSCDREKLSDSLKSILKTYEKEVRDNFKALNTDTSAKPPEKPGWIAPGTKYAGISITDDTVILEFMIEESMDVREGDKLCFANSSKSIAAYVTEKPHFSESGVPIDALFSTTSVINRIVSSPFLGVAERNMDELKRQALDIYFDDKK